MIGIPGVRTYYLYRKPTDMRKSFNGLGGVVNNEMGKDLLSGDGFIFLNKRRTLIKVLVWDRTGYVIYYKSWLLALWSFRIGKKTSRHSNWRYRPY
ncbi:MAG: IS66 family insertion sequence element accessory protein TnpB [Saprospiraceae bacterium]|nr:IS66 family insertion sequence element accessory protein TnpB [Saprospiraceae bacterium]